MLGPQEVRTIQTKERVNIYDVYIFHTQQKISILVNIFICNQIIKVILLATWAVQTLRYTPKNNN